MTAIGYFRYKAQTREEGEKERGGIGHLLKKLSRPPKETGFRSPPRLLFL
jgi:hypothetical protein